jgi:hypothetical protein
MKMAPLLLLLTAFVAGCAGVRTLISEAEIRPLGSGLYVMLSTDSPAGQYVLETRGGTPIARALHAPSPQNQRSVGFGQRIPVPMKVDVRSHPEARGCLRIRRPDGKVLGIGASSQTEFQLPALEAAYIQQVEMPALQLAEREYPNNQRTVSSTRQWLATSPAELTSDKTCRVPVASAAACRSEAAAMEAAKKPCFEANFACSIAGASVDTIISQLSDDKKGAATIANYLSANACSLAVDANYGQKSDLMSYLRSIGATLTVDALYRSLVNDNPGINETYALAATAGVINYGLCVRDAVTQCRDQNVRWERYARGQYRGCVERLSRFQRSSDFLEKYGAPIDIQRELQTKQSRIAELTSRSMFQRTPLIDQVRSCS